MKRTTPMLLTVLLLCALTCLAMAAEATELLPLAPPQGTLYPVEVTEYIQDGHARLTKTYVLTSGDDPAAIPTADFEREGCTYTLLDLTCRDNAETDTKLHAETVTMPSKSKDMDDILPLLPVSREVTTQDGYTGALTLDIASVKVDAAGYGTSSRAVTATRSYPNLSDADVSFVLKTTEDNGRTLELADVQWQEAGGFYHATATYTGTATSKYATGYTVTASYTGEVSKTTSDTVTYTAVFGNALPQTEKQAAEGGSGWSWLLILPIGVGVAGLSVLGRFLKKKYKAKKNWKEYAG